MVVPLIFQQVSLKAKKEKIFSLYSHSYLFLSFKILTQNLKPSQWTLSIKRLATMGKPETNLGLNPHSPTKSCMAFREEFNLPKPQSPQICKKKQTIREQ